MKWKIVILQIVLVSCSMSVSDLVPRYKSDQNALSNDIRVLIQYQQLDVEAKQQSATGQRTSRQLDVTLTNADIKSYSREKLDSLSGKISLAVKKHVLNLQTYDWLSVMYITSDGSPASDSTDHNVYVIRPDDIK